MSGSLKKRQPADTPESQRGRALLNLRELLLRGEFRPGERIFQVPLAARLGVSRTPLRLALERLAQEGLLEPAGSAGGFTVREFTVRDIWDALEARGVLEGAAARLAAERLSDKSELEPLRQIHNELEKVAQPYIIAPGIAAPSEVTLQTPNSTAGSTGPWWAWPKARCCAGRWIAFDPSLSLLPRLWSRAGPPAASPSPRISIGPFWIAGEPRGRSSRDADARARRICQKVFGVSLATARTEHRRSAGRSLSQD